MLTYNFECLDTALLREIQRGRGRFDQLSNTKSPLLTLAEPYRLKDVWRGRTPVKRVIELRLQALKELGLIAWDGMRWRIL